MRLLAVETSGEVASVALMVDHAIVEDVTLSGEGRRHAQTLVSEVGELLQRQSLAATDVDVVAVSNGPGSFTGLRVGVVFAKTFAWVNAARVVAVNTLQATAQRISAEQPIVTAVSDAQREELFVGEFDWDDASGIRRCRRETHIVPVDELSAVGVLTGPALTKFRARIVHTDVADSALWLPTAVSVAELGHAMAEQGEWSDLDQLEPVYIRRSYAEEKQK